MPPIPKTDIKNLVEWQKRIDDNKSLGLLSIPGTHNSAACHLSLPSVQCQGASITSQLEHGIRFFDIRCAAPFTTACGGFLGSSEDDLQVIHGAFPVKLPKPVKVADALNEIYRFVEKHPSEAVVVSLKAEGSKDWQGDEFADIIWDKYVNAKKEKWYLENKIPKMGECRGKVVLFRRFGCKNQDRKDRFGIDAAWWKYNCESDDRGKIVVQDWCEVMKPDDIKKKQQVVDAHIKRAVDYNSTQHNEEKLHVNFCSGSNFWNPKCWPKNVAQGVNKTVEGNAESGCGIIIIDYAEQEQWGVVRSLVEMNFNR